MNLDVCFTPDQYASMTKASHTAVVIDVLRATTSIATALANGCREIYPLETVKEAFLLRDKFFPEALLAGERGGLLIQGFNLGNSPFDYHREKVAGRIIIMTTTNGTAALRKAAGGVVLTAAFVNAAAVCSRLLDLGQDTVIICAGTQGRFSFEDALCAGLICERLTDKANLSDTAFAARAMYQGARCELRDIVYSTSHARHLAAIGFQDDVAYCLEHDVLAVVPEYQDGRLLI